MPEHLTLATDDNRILGLAAAPILKVLRIRREVILRRMYGDFRAGVKDHTATVAEFAAIESLMSDIEDKQRSFNKGDQR